MDDRLDSKVLVWFMLGSFVLSGRDSSDDSTASAFDGSCSSEPALSILCLSEAMMPNDQMTRRGWCERKTVVGHGRAPRRL